ncbi:hypothetical protein [Massilia phosphatilytica]
MTDYHVITPEAAELVMQVVDGELIIVPPSPDQQSEYAPEITEMRS